MDIFELCQTLLSDDDDDEENGTSRKQLQHSLSILQQEQDRVDNLQLDEDFAQQDVEAIVLLESGRWKVYCPWCSSKATLISGAKRYEKYTYSCFSCNMRWNQLIPGKPNEEGGYDVTISRRRIGLEARLNQSYKCGRCGACPKFGHICPMKGKRKRESVPLDVLVGQTLAEAEEAIMCANAVTKLDAALVVCLTGDAVLNALLLTRNFVKGDGSCWIYSVLAAFGFCESANPTCEREPSALDQGRDAVCRQLVHDYLTSNNSSEADEKDIASIDSLLRAPVYPLLSPSDMGSFGTSFTISGLAQVSQTTIVMWNTNSLQNDKARQQVVEVKNSSCLETNWSNKEILVYSLANPCVHILWNGADHYSALLPPFSVQCGPSFAAKMVAAEPANKWLVVENGFRHDPASFKNTAFYPSTPMRELREACVAKGYNAIFLLYTESIVRFAKFDFEVRDEDAVRPEGFACDMHILNAKNEGKKAPNAFCHCNAFRRGDQQMLSCDVCDRLVHMSCTKFASYSADQLAALDCFFCRDCE